MHLKSLVPIFWRLWTLYVQGLELLHATRGVDLHILVDAIIRLVVKNPWVRWAKYKGVKRSDRCQLGK